MEQPLFIDKSEGLKKGQDYSYLRAEGIKYIQELTGAYWTDYNEHDPGVTILEQLCYALTDLSFRTDFDIQDHLFDSENKEHSFLRPDEILPCNALTVNDYRKLIFDSIFDINNVWVIPIDPSENTISGLYKILLDVNENITDQEHRKNIITKTKDVFCDNRNLCEDVEEVKILDPAFLSVHADVEVDGAYDIEGILANIFFKVDEYLSPEIRFYSLEELLNEGFKLDEIFTGPLLKHGFIKSEELYPKPRKILISEITKILMQVEGVASVKNLYLKFGNKVYDNQIDIEEGRIPKLVTDIEDETGHHAIQFVRGAVNYSSIDGKSVRRTLNELKSANKRVYRLSEENMKMDKGKELNVEEYYSVQNQFPVNYGIGQYGVPVAPSAKRNAQAKQLKGYMMIFEQIIANYLSQLSHAKDLFSLKKNIDSTYYYQQLDNVPDVEPLYKEEKGAFIDDPMLSEHKIPKSYTKGLGHLVKLSDNFVDRRDRFLDYLLGLHGESFQEYSLSQFNHYFDDREFALHLIQSKVRLLNSLSTLNRDRARAFNYRKEGINTNNITGMEARIAILMGLGVSGVSDIEEYKTHSVLSHYKGNNLKLKDGNIPKKQAQKWYKEGSIDALGISLEDIEKDYDFVDEEELNLDDIPEDERKALLTKTLPFRSKTILADFISEGMVLYNFRIGKSGKVFNIVYNKPKTTDWLHIASYEKYDEAVAGVLELVAFLRTLNIQSEGLHILEHTLLRPEVTDKRFGIYLLDEDRKSFFRSTGLYTFEGRKKAIEALKPEIGKYENYSVEMRDDGDFEVHFKTKNNKIHLVSLGYRESVEKTHEKMEQLYRFLSDADDIVPFENKVALYVQNSPDGSRLPEDFLAFRISALFPSWTNRFNDQEFRAIIEDTVKTHCPANIASRSFWLSPDEMDEFEGLYYSWMDGKRKNGDNLKETDELRIQLSEYLFKLYDIES